MPMSWDITPPCQPVDAAVPSETPSSSTGGTEIIGRVRSNSAKMANPSPHPMNQS